MGTIVYHNLLSFLLDEGDCTLSELIEQGATRYDFDRNRMMFEFEMALKMMPNHIQLIGDGKYHKISEFADTDSLLGFVKRAPVGYFEAHPLWKKFYDDLEKKRCFDN